MIARSVSMMVCSFACRLQAVSSLRLSGPYPAVCNASLHRLVCSGNNSYTPLLPSPVFIPSLSLSTEHHRYRPLLTSLASQSIPSPQHQSSTQTATDDIQVLQTVDMPASYIRSMMPGKPTHRWQPLAQSHIHTHSPPSFPFTPTQPPIITQLTEITPTQSSPRPSPASCWAAS